MVKVVTHQQAEEFEWSEQFRSSISHNNGEIHELFRICFKALSRLMCFMCQYEVILRVRHGSWIFCFNFLLHLFYTHNSEPSCQVLQYSSTHLPIRYSSTVECSIAVQYDSAVLASRPTDGWALNRFPCKVGTGWSAWNTRTEHLHWRLLECVVFYLSIWLIVVEAE